MSTKPWHFMFPTNSAHTMCGRKPSTNMRWTEDERQVTCRKCIQYMLRNDDEVDLYQWKKFPQ